MIYKGPVETSVNMGFQHMKPIVHEQASRKGGSVRKKKGLAALPPEKVKEITSMGGKQSAENYRSKKGAKQTEAGQSEYTPRLADILGDIDEELSQ